VSSNVRTNGHAAEFGESSLTPSAPPTPEAIKHLALAMCRYVRQRRQLGLRVPAEIEALAAFLMSSVTIRPRPTAVIEDLGAMPHDHVVGQLLVTKAEAAERLGVSTRTVERLVAAGRLPLVHVERAARLRVSDLEAFVNGLTDDHEHTSGECEPP
jgi:excisionase family DNA binding protein